VRTLDLVGPRTSEPAVRPLDVDDPDERAWAAAMLRDAFTSTLAARKGEVVDTATLPGHVATVGGRREGLAVVAVRGDEYEVVALSTSAQGHGVGRALMECCFEEARALGCRRVWLTTTNDNVAAIAFYQRIGMDLCAFHRHAVRAARRLKPSIPLRGAMDVPMEHELEFELVLEGPSEAP
jgi:ribosomal protein S18 acetylase RimI-like enzyme